MEGTGGRPFDFSVETVDILAVKTGGFVALEEVLLDVDVAAVATRFVAAVDNFAGVVVP